MALRAQIIVESQGGSGGAARFAFVHNLIPVTLSESVILVRRQRLHMQAARAIETIHPDDYEALAHHFAEAGELARSSDFYRRAGDRARPVAPADAARFYRKALDFWTDGGQAERADMTARLANTLWWVGDAEGALQYFNKAYDLFVQLENRTRSGEMKRMMGLMEWTLGDHRLSMQYYQDALTLLEQGPETAELARSISSISQSHMLAAEKDLAIQWGERAVAMAERLGTEDVVVQALNNMGTALGDSSSDFEKGIGMLEESLRRSMRAGLASEACRAYVNIESVQRIHCRYASARETMQKLYAYAEKVQAKRYANVAIFHSMWIDWLTGQWGSALSNRSKLADFGSTMYAIWVSRNNGMIDLDLGRIEEGRLALEESLPGALQAKDAQTTAPHLGQLIRAYAESGMEAKTLDMTHLLLEYVSSTGQLLINSMMPLFFACQQLSKMASPDLEADRAACLAQLERHASQFMTGEADAALAEARGCLARATDPLAAAGYFRRAVAGWESISRPYDKARALAAQGDALAVAGDSSAAGAAWNEAFQVYEFLARQLDSETQTTFRNSAVVNAVRRSVGSTSHPGPVQETDSLSKRETEVLELVAEGLTNAQIARRLVLSPLTVNAHLRSIFNKLDVSNRTAAVHQAKQRNLI